MRLTTILTASIGLFLPAPAFAELFYYEPFLTSPTPNPAVGEYAIGLLDPTTAGDGQNPIIGPTPFLTGPWETLGETTANAAIQAQGLTFLGAPALGGSQISTPDSDVRRNLSAPWTETMIGTRYVSFLANFGTGNYDDGMDINDLGYRSVEFYDSGNTFLFGISYNAYNGPFGRFPNQAPMHIDGFGTFQQFEGAPESFAADGITHLIVLKFELSATDASDTLSVYLDPTTLDEPVLANALVTGVNVTLGSIGGFTIFGGSGQGPVLDEMRVADSFIDAVPDFPRKGNTNPGTGPGQDDFVDMFDYQVIITHMNMTGQPITSGDVTGDGRVDLNDLRLWRDNRTDIPGGSSDDVSVPEPGALILVMMLMAPLCGRRALA